MIKNHLDVAKMRVKRTSLMAVAIVMAVAGLVPLTFQGIANADTLATRSVTISTSQPSATGVSYSFSFTPTTSVVMQGLVFKFCTAPLGTCTLPTGMNVGYATVAYGSQSGFSQPASFAEYSGANAGSCDGQGTSGDNTATTYCLTRTAGTAEDTAAKTVVINTVTNPSIPSGNNTTVYVRVGVYSDSTFTTLQHDGVVAASIVNQLTVIGRVQERLVFCVFALDDAAGSSATVGTAATNYPTSCSATEANASSVVDLGVIDNSSIAKAPVNNTPPSSTGNDRFGAAIVNTNASNGVAVAYYASQAATGTNELRAFRVPGATCNVSGTSLVDQCFVSASSSGETLTAGTERFGMQVACITNSTTQAAAGTTSNLGSVTAAYDGDSVIADTGSRDCQTAEVSDKFAWNATGTAVNLASSTTVVDDELIKMRFGATASATTPTGAYTVQSTYIATPTF